MNHYEALGVGMDANVDQIRRAYLDAARRHHPDFHAAADEPTRGEHARRMQLVNEAWGVLSDPRQRARYDLNVSRPLPMQERPRPNRGPAVPAGKGWTPRRGDDGWQSDFRSWADETDVMPPDLAGPARSRGPLVVLPVGLFALGIVSVVVGVVMSARPLLAAGAAALVCSTVLFMVLPLVEMARGRRRRERSAALSGRTRRRAT